MFFDNFPKNGIYYNCWEGAIGPYNEHAIFTTFLIMLPNNIVLKQEFKDQRIVLTNDELLELGKAAIRISNELAIDESDLYSYDNQELTQYTRTKDFFKAQFYFNKDMNNYIEYAGLIRNKELVLSLNKRHRVHDWEKDKIVLRKDILFEQLSFKFIEFPIKDFYDQVSFNNYSAAKILRKFPKLFKAYQDDNFVLKKIDDDQIKLSKVINKEMFEHIIDITITFKKNNNLRFLVEIFYIMLDKGNSLREMDHYSTKPFYFSCENNEEHIIIESKKTINMFIENGN